MFHPIKCFRLVDETQTRYSLLSIDLFIKVWRVNIAFFVPLSETKSNCDFIISKDSLYLTRFFMIRRSIFVRWVIKLIVVMYVDHIQSFLVYLAI